MTRSYSVKIPEKYKSKYFEEQMGSNLDRLMMTGTAILIIQIFAIISNLINPFTSHQIIIEHYFQFYYYTISANLALLILAHVVKFSKLGLLYRRGFIYLYLYFQILWGAGVALADQFQGEQIVVYYTLVFIFAIILDIETSSFLVIVAVNHVMFFLLLTIYERFYTTVFGLRAGSTQIVSFIILLRFYLHELLKRNFVQREVLNENSEKVKRLEMFDELTGLMNRKQWEVSYEKAYTSALMTKRPLGILLLDIDSYKLYNENYGHTEGDILLSELGELTSSITNTFHGVSGRYSGDKIIVYFDNADKFQMEFFIKKFEHELEILDFEHKYSLVSDKVTVSTGQYFAIPPDEHSLWRFYS